MTIPKLLPCPFCGDEAEIERIGNSRISTIYCCKNCGCRLETGETFNHGKRWNTRPTEAAIRDATLIKVSRKMCSLCRDEREVFQRENGGWWHHVARGGDLGDTEPCKAWACHEIRALKSTKTDGGE